MDYKEKYEQALERARQFSEKPYLEDSAGIVEYIFPELKESEDERIRKALIKLVKKAGEGYENVIDGVSIENAIAWLEKQVEHKPAFEMKTPEESLGIDSDTYNKIVDECIYGEQKPAEWNEEDDILRRRCIGAIQSSSTSEGVKKELVDWLKSLKDRVQLQPRQEWSEEDEMIRKAIINYFQCQSRDEPSRKEIHNKWISWLKSLKSQTQWKPSDEQMNALNDVISSRDIKYDVLSELWKELKNLKD